MTLAKEALKDVTFFPFWLDSPDAPPVEDPLPGDTDADIVIVGGGFTGLWASIIAKEAHPGRDIVIIEAGKVAHGASGRPCGIISTSLVHGLTNGQRIFPNDLAILEKLGQANMDGFIEALERYAIDAHAEWGGELTIAIGDEHIADIEREYDLHIEHGHDAVFLDRDAVRAQINSPLYSAAVWSKTRCGTVHPARLAWGLKKAALSLGVRLFEETPLTGLEDDGSGILVRTESGRIRTEKVLLATNAFAAGHKNIRRRVALVRDRLIATEPLSGEQLDRIAWHQRQGAYDTRTQLNHTRLTKDNRIIFGGRIGYHFNGDPDPAGDKRIDPYVKLAGAFQATFPQLDDVKFTHAWSGPIGMTTRLAVHFQRYFDDRVIYAGGYSGYGISASRFGARMGLALLDGSHEPECRLDIVRTLPNWIPPEPFRWLGAAITVHALDTADEKGGWRKLWVRFVRKLGIPV